MSIAWPPAIGPASFRLPQSPAAFGGEVHPVAPGSHSKPAGVTPPAASLAFARRLAAGLPTPVRIDPGAGK